MNVNDSLFDPISEKILIIRGQFVILDRDLAGLYGVETKELNRAAKRNTERFDEDFMFQLTIIEKDELVTNWHRFNTLKHSAFMPYAFTEIGISMLSSLKQRNSHQGKQANNALFCKFDYTD